MRIAILSDSHDNVANLEKIIAWLNQEKISIMIHAGDVAAPGVLIKVLGPKFPGQIHLINGNVGDPELLGELAKGFANVKYYGHEGELEIDGQRIALTHFPERAEELARTGKYDLAVFGHSHQAEIKKIGQTLLLNPGTSGGLFAEPTFALYDTEKREGEIINVADTKIK